MNWEYFAARELVLVEIRRAHLELTAYLHKLDIKELTPLSIFKSTQLGVQTVVVWSFMGLVGNYFKGVLITILF